MKSGTCFAAICGTVALHTVAAVLAIRLSGQPDVAPVAEPPLIHAHLTPRALPVAAPQPAPTPAAPPAKPHTPAVRPAPKSAPPTPIAKASPAPASLPPTSVALAEARPVPAANPAPPAVVPQPASQAAPSAPAAPIKAGPSISASYAANNHDPDYPLISRRYGEQGTVVLRVYVKADGSAGEVQIKTSSGHELLDESAKAAVQSWRFNPATIDGKPIAEWYQLPIPFKLKSSQHN